jgi:hypothetical protein
MPYTIDVFTNWSGFGTWAALKSWLTSEEGGKLRVVEPHHSAYALVRYVKGQSDFTKPHVPWCRSVVVDRGSCLPVCVAPPKASKLTDTSAEEATIAEEFVDGTMVNLFCVGDTGLVNLATRSRLGGKSRFYETGPTFEEMFQDALKAHSIPSMNDILPSDPVASSVFTSTVLQHPSNRIVKSIGSPTFQLVHQGRVFADGRVELEEDASEMQCAKEGDFFEIQPYSLNAVKGAKSVESWVSQQGLERGFGWQGLVLKDGKGRRWRVRSLGYETVRRIRGNESTAEERFARLRKDRIVEQYISFYPEDRPQLYELEGRLRKNTRQLAQFYTDVFRTRKTPYHELPWPYKHHVSVLHNIFKDHLRAKEKKIDLEEVIRYVNGLTSEDLANMTKVHTLELRKSEPKKTVEAPSVEEPTTA